MDKKDEYLRAKQAQLDIWNYAIVTMSAKADKASSQVRNDYNHQMALLLLMQATAREKIKKLRETEGSLWEELKPDMELVWKEMAKLMESAGHHFR